MVEVDVRDGENKQHRKYAKVQNPFRASSYAKAFFNIGKKTPQGFALHLL